MQLVDAWISSSCFIQAKYYWIGLPIPGTVMKDNEISYLHRENRLKEETPLILLILLINENQQKNQWFSLPENLILSA